MPQDFFSSLSKSLATIATSPIVLLVAVVTRHVEEFEIFLSRDEKSLAQMPQDFFQTLQHPLSQLPQAQLFFLWQLWQDMLRSLKFFWCSDEKSLAQMPQDFSQTSQNRLSQLPQDWNISKQRWKVIVTNATRFFSKVSKPLVTIVTRPILANLT